MEHTPGSLVLEASVATACSSKAVIGTLFPNLTEPFIII
jgi:hypothetical protein